MGNDRNRCWAVLKFLFLGDTSNYALIQGSCQVLMAELLQGPEAISHHLCSSCQWWELSAGIALFWGGLTSQLHPKGSDSSSYEAGKVKLFGIVL